MLPDAVVRLREPGSYRVPYSDRRRTVQDALKAEIQRHEVYASR
jgi:hypothetical protein